MRRPNAPKVNPDSESNESMDPNKLQWRATRPGYRSAHAKPSDPRSKFYLYTSVFLSLVLFCYILFFRRDSDVDGLRYMVFIDGGSTGTRIHVFKYEVRHGNFVLDFSDKGLASTRANPGLSAYAGEPERAGRSVAELMEFAKKNVPRQQWGDTEVRLMATAGMRLLASGDQDRILSACRRVLMGSGFKFRDDWATVISGSDEGLYAWVVANYALGSLGGEPAQTTGIIELGGASAQVTFVTDEPVPVEFSRRIKFGNFTYNLYSHSFLQFGQNVAFELLKDYLISGEQKLASEFIQSEKPLDPCTPRGYLHDDDPGKLSPTSLIKKSKYLSSLLPNGNFSECRSASLNLLKKGQDNCSYQTCYIGTTFMPKLQGKFLATENFFHSSKFFGLSQTAFLSGLVVEGQQFCGEDWSRLTEKYRSLEEDELLRYCFSSAYIVALLHDSLGIALDDPRIGYANQVHNIPLDWALGAFILQSAVELDAKRSSWFVSITSGDSSRFPVLFVIFLVLALVLWFVSKWSKPRLKTIYDLEKGKYIITKIRRYS